MEKPMVASLYGDDPSNAQPMVITAIVGPVAVVVAGGAGIVVAAAVVESETYIHFHHYEYTYSKTNNE